jgi:hypothetical protein
MNVPEPRPLAGLEISATATTTVAAIGVAPHCARLGRDNSVSPNRHNLLTATFWRASIVATESEHQNKTNNLK